MRRADRAGNTSDTEAGMPEALRRYVDRVMRDVRAAYRQAGEPLGPGDRSMVIWYEFGQIAELN